MKAGGIPENWCLRKLGQIIEFENGKAHEDCIIDEGQFVLVNSRFISTNGTVRKFSLENRSPLFCGDIVMVMSDVPNGKALAKCFLIDKNNKYTLNQRICVLRTNSNSSKFLYYVLDRNQYYLQFDNGVGQTNLRKNEVLDCPILLPPLLEQTAIASLLSTSDQAIEKIKRLIVVKEKRYAHLVSSLIASDRHYRGHIRDFTTEVSKRNSGAAIDRVLSVTNNNGFVLPEDQFERRVASSDLRNYKVVTIGQYAYNPSRINVGSIARLDGWDKGVLSPMYVVFEIDEKKVNSDFFLHWLESHGAKEGIRKSAQGSVRETVSFTDLGAIAFPLPPRDRQLVIAQTLNTARLEITLLKKQADAYRKQKRGLMKKLLTGQWRVKTKEENA